MPESALVVVVMGVSGSGKSTVGRLLAEALDADFHDGDDFHPPENRRKMASGSPLDDTDRWPWLDALGRQIDSHLRDGSRAVLACSALKASYRDRLRRHGPTVRFVHLRGTPELIARRLAGRQGHFMPPELLQSQFDALEEPTDAVAVDIDQPPRRIVEDLVRTLIPRA